MCLVHIEDEGLNAIGHIGSNLIGWLLLHLDHCPHLSLVADHTLLTDGEAAG